MIIFKGYTHILFAVALYNVFFPFNLFAVCIIALGSLVPDIDHPFSILGRYNVFASLMKHRGFMHTLPALALWFIPFISAPQLYLYFAWGYILHLLGDTFNKTGIMWLYPYKKKYYSFFSDDIYGIEAIFWGLSVLSIFVR